MGTNVFYLTDLLNVPSYRRTRAQPASTVAQGPWAAMARRRAALPLQPATPPCHDAPAPAEPVLPSTATASTAAAQVAVVRVTRAASSMVGNGASGRLRISGRLIDVCAELERLAAAEAALADARPLCA